MRAKGEPGTEKIEKRGGELKGSQEWRRLKRGEES